MGEGENRVEDRSMWIDLPMDLLELILRRLVLTDHLRFRAVCNTWRSIHHVKPMNPLPCLLICRKPRERTWAPFLSSWKLYDPSSGNTHTVEFEDHKDLSSLEVRASKHGWLLLSQKCRDDEPNRNRLYLSLFLYNPFTKERINLPNLVMKSVNYASTFSSLPTLPDCLVINRDFDMNNRLVYISTCRCGDETWTTRTFDFSFIPLFATDNRKLAFFNGVFYYLNDNWGLVSFNVAECRLSVLLIPDWIRNTGLLNSEPFETHLVESDGELLFVFVSPKGSWVHIWRLDHSQMAWIKVENLGNQTLFVGPISLSMDTKMDGIESGIYFRSRYGGVTMFLTLKAGPLSLKAVPSCHFFDSCKLLPESFFMERIWIESP